MNEVVSKDMHEVVFKGIHEVVFKGMSEVFSDVLFLCEVTVNSEQSRDQTKANQEARTSDSDKPV
jgi:hypothetical protein